ncbi:MAG: hypothetical protein ACREMY_27350, partial [bacterium]
PKTSMFPPTAICTTASTGRRLKTTAGGRGHSPDGTAWRRRDLIPVPAGENVVPFIKRKPGPRTAGATPEQ